MVNFMSITDEAWNAAQNAEYNYWISRGFFGLQEEQAKMLKYFFEAPNSFKGTVVELGPGPCGYTSIISADKKIAIEPLTNKFRTLFTLPKDVEYLQGKGEAIPLPNDCADVVFCSNVLAHVQNPTKVLEEVKRILKVGGVMYYSMYFDSESTLHPFAFTRNEAKNLIEKTFRIEQVIDKWFKWGAICQKT
jgi:SAM-dependent methyltransferase